MIMCVRVCMYIYIYTHVFLCACKAQELSARFLSGSLQAYETLGISGFGTRIGAFVNLEKPTQNPKNPKPSSLHRAGATLSAAQLSTSPATASLRPPPCVTEVLGRDGLRPVVAQSPKGPKDPIVRY